MCGLEKVPCNPASFPLSPACVHTAAAAIATAVVTTFIRQPEAQNALANLANGGRARGRRRGAAYSRAYYSHVRACIAWIAARAAWCAICAAAARLLGPRYASGLPVSLMPLSLFSSRHPLPDHLAPQNPLPAFPKKPSAGARGRATTHRHHRRLLLHRLDWSREPTVI